MYTDQTAFDAMVRHLASMKDGRSSFRGRCLYRGPNGKKCAVGALIPDEMYKPNMDKIIDSNSVSGLIKNYPDVGKLLANVNVELLKDMQGVHDDYDNWDVRSHTINKSGVHEIYTLAKNYSLSPDVIKEVFPDN